LLPPPSAAAFARNCATFSAIRFCCSSFALAAAAAAALGGVALWLFFAALDDDGDGVGELRRLLLVFAIIDHYKYLIQSD
jgi:hypothetical protein